MVDLFICLFKINTFLIVLLLKKVFLLQFHDFSPFVISLLFFFHFQYYVIALSFKKPLQKSFWKIAQKVEWGWEMETKAIRILKPVEGAFCFLFQRHEEQILILPLSLLLYLRRRAQCLFICHFIPSLSYTNSHFSYRLSFCNSNLCT